MSPQTPVSEVEIAAPLVRGLLAEQHPDLADLPLERIDEGWDNVMYRLGESLTVRLPRRSAAAELIRHEQAWLPILAPVLPIPVPVPTRIGHPTGDYPWFWSIGPWIEGRPANLNWPRVDQAPVLAAFLRALHQPSPTAAPVNPFRGVPLRDRAPVVEPCLERLRSALGRLHDPLVGLWTRALAAAPSTLAVWLHGDLHARNVLARDGVITGVIDWGDMTGGDAATDLSAAWSLLADPGARRVMLKAYDPSPDLIARAMGWAISHGTVLLESGLADHPLHEHMGRVTLERLVADG